MFSTYFTSSLGTQKAEVLNSLIMKITLECLLYRILWP